MISMKKWWDDFSCNPLFKHNENDNKGGKLFLVTYYASMLVLVAMSLSWTNFPSLYERLQNNLENKSRVPKEEITKI